MLLQLLHGTWGRPPFGRCVAAYHGNVGSIGGSAGASFPGAGVTYVAAGGSLAGGAAGAVKVPSKPIVRCVPSQNGFRDE